MYLENNDYWFTIEPYVYSNIKKHEIILLNTLNGYVIRNSNNDIVELVRKTQSKEQLSVTLLKRNELDNKHIYEFVRELRENFMGDIINISLSNGKPIQFIPEINLLSNNEITTNIQKELIGQNILDFLNEINISISTGAEKTYFKQIGYHINSEKSETIHNLSFEKLQSFLNTLANSSLGKVIIQGSSIMNRPDIDKIIAFLNSFKKCIELAIEVSIINDYLIRSYQKKMIIIVTSANIPLLVEKLNSLKRVDCKFLFIVEEQKHLDEFDVLVSSYQIEEYQLIPLYNGNNLSFFEECIFLDESDITSVSDTIKDIHTKYLINTNDFGKLYITSDGEIYANLNKSPIGTINDNIRELIYKEIDLGTSWRRTRDMEPCCNCVYQWLCPSPSNYELAIGKPNLCHVKQ